MNKINNLLSTCTWLLHNERASSDLDYLSRIDGENAAWYFWLKEAPGVYELKLFQQRIEDECECSDFVLKYYPAVEEDAFEDFSCLEQLVRLGDFFEQGEVIIPENIDVCPCCGGNHEEYAEQHICHEHTHQHDCMDTYKPENVKRSKGIPKLSCRKQLPMNLFQIGTMCFKIHGEELLEATLTAQDAYISYAEDGVKVKDADGTEHQILEPGGVDRKVQGLFLSQRFCSFFKGKMLASLKLMVKKEIREEAVGEVIYNKGNKLKNIKSSEVKKIKITYFLERGICND